MSAAKKQVSFPQAAKQTRVSRFTSTSALQPLWSSLAKSGQFDIETKGSKVSSNLNALPPIPQLIGMNSGVLRCLRYLKSRLAELETAYRNLETKAQEKQLTNEKQLDQAHNALTELRGVYKRRVARLQRKLESFATRESEKQQEIAKLEAKLQEQEKRHQTAFAVLLESHVALQRNVEQLERRIFRLADANEDCSTPTTIAVATANDKSTVNSLPKTEAIKTNPEAVQGPSSSGAPIPSSFVCRWADETKFCRQLAGQVQQCYDTHQRIYNALRSQVPKGPSSPHHKIDSQGTPHRQGAVTTQQEISPRSNTNLAPYQTPKTRRKTRTQSQAPTPSLDGNIGKKGAEFQLTVALDKTPDKQSARQINAAKSNATSRKPLPNSPPFPLKQKAAQPQFLVSRRRVPRPFKDQLDQKILAEDIAAPVSVLQQQAHINAFSCLANEHTLCASSSHAPDSSSSLSSLLGTETLLEEALNNPFTSTTAPPLSPELPRHAANTETSYLKPSCCSPGRLHSHLVRSQSVELPKMQLPVLERSGPMPYEKLRYTGIVFPTSPKHEKAGHETLFGGGKKNGLAIDSSSLMSFQLLEPHFPDPYAVREG